MESLSLERVGALHSVPRGSCAGCRLWDAVSGGLQQESNLTDVETPNHTHSTKWSVITARLELTRPWTGSSRSALWSSSHVGYGVHLRPTHSRFQCVYPRLAPRRVGGERLKCSARRSALHIARFRDGTTLLSSPWRLAGVECVGVARSI